MTYAQTEHLISLLTKIGASIVYVLFVVYGTGVSLSDVTINQVAMFAFILFAVQIIAQMFTTILHGFFVKKRDRVIDDRDREILSRADQVGGYVLGVALMTGLGLVAFGNDGAVLIYTLVIGGLLMGLVSDSLRIYWYRQ